MGTYDEYLDRTNAAIAWPQNWISKRVLKNFFRIAKVKPSETKLLEIGTGTARTGFEAKKLGVASYVGVEPNAALAAFSREALQCVIIEEALPNVESVRDDSVDAILTLHVLEHASSFTEAREWCVEMKRMLKPGGALLIAAPNVLDWKDAFWDTDWTHGYPTTPKRVSQLFRDVGMEVVLSKTMHFGSLNPIAAIMAHIIDWLTPRRLFDALLGPVFRRPIATGVKLAFLWGLTFVVARRID